MPGRAEKEVTVLNSLGLHARPAMLLAKTASRFHSDIHLIRDDESVDASSTLSILMMAAAMGSVLRVEATGDDAENAVEEISRLFAGKFGEPE